MVPNEKKCRTSLSSPCRIARAAAAPKVAAPANLLAEDAAGLAGTRHEGLLPLQDFLLADAVGPTDAVVCTTGFTSREVYELRARLGQPVAPHHGRLDRSRVHGIAAHALFSELDS